MPDDPDTMEVAREMAREFGPAADAECLRRAQQCLDLGDPAGMLTWHEIRAAILVLRRPDA